MKVLKSLFDEMLEHAKKLTGDARKSMLDYLRSVQVYEVDAKGVETPIEIQIAEISPDTQKALQHEFVTAEQAKALVDEALAKAGHKPAPPIGQPPAKFAIPKHVQRVGSLKAFKGEQGGFTADERAYRFAMWAMACMGNEKAASFCAENGLSVKLHSEGQNTAGGYLVPEEFGTDLIRLTEQYGVVRGLFKVVPMKSDTRSDPRRVSGLTAYFTGEGNAATESTKGWDRVQLVAKKLTVLSRITNEVNEDSAINLGDDLLWEIALAFALKEDQCGLIGDASQTYGGIEGVTAKLKRINGVDDGGGLVLASGNLFSEFALADFNKVVGALPQYADGPTTKWVAHRTFYYGTMQRLELAAGGVTAFEVREGNRTPMFLGYGVAISQVMPSTDANSQIACTLGDHAKAATLGDRRQPSIAFSTDATIGGESVFERDEIAVRATERFDINVHDVGSAAAAGPVVGLISAAS